MGCGCGGSNRQVVPRRDQVRQQGAPVPRGAHTLGGNGTVWNGPEPAAPVPSEVVAAAEPQPAEA